MKQPFSTLTKSERRIAHQTQSYSRDLFDTSLPKLMPKYKKKPVETSLKDYTNMTNWTVEEMFQYIDLCNELGIKIN